MDAKLLMCYVFKKQNAIVYFVFEIIFESILHSTDYGQYAKILC